MHGSITIIFACASALPGETGDTKIVSFN